MTWNLAQTMSMIKAAQHKYTHRKMIGRDPKTNRIRYRYYYAEHHGGGITSASIEEGAAFKLTFKGRRGHFHVQRVEGDKVYVKHDGRPNAKEVEMTKSELRALLKRQHETIENKKREKAQEARRKGRKKPAKKRPAPQKSPEEKVNWFYQGDTSAIFTTEPEVRAFNKIKDYATQPKVYTDGVNEIKRPKPVANYAHQSVVAELKRQLKRVIAFKNNKLRYSEIPEKKRDAVIEKLTEALGLFYGPSEEANIDNVIVAMIGSDDFDIEPASINRRESALKINDFLNRKLLKTTQPTDQRSQAAQAFSGMVDAIKSGEGTQEAQRAFKAELNKVIDKTESGTLTDAERAELLPLAEQLIEATTGEPRELMTAIRDQIKGSSEETAPQTPSAEYKETRAEILKETYGDFNRKKIRELEQRLKTQQGPDSERASEAHINAILTLVKTPKMERLINDVVASHKGTNPPRQQLNAISQYLAEQAPTRAPLPEDQSLESLKYELAKVRERASADLERVSDEKLIPPIIAELDAQRDAAYDAIPSEPNNKRRKAQEEYYKREALAMATRHAYSTAITSSIQERTNKQIQELEQLIFDKEQERAEERALAREAKQ